MFDYKKLGIKSFKRGKFDEAMLYFSLAYDECKDEGLLFYINLCSFAKNENGEANMLFELYRTKELKKSNMNGIDELLEILESKTKEDPSLSSIDAIDYADFKKMVKQSDFKSVFESVMFSTKVLISNREDFLEFIDELIKNDFLEMGINYIESAANMFSGDKKLDGIIRQILERKR